MYVEGNEDDHSHQPYAEADKRVRSEAGQIQAVRGESRRIRPVGRQPCRIYRCGVVSRPRQDVQTRKGKHWNERQPNDTAHANDRDGNGLRGREYAGRPGAGPIRAVRPSPDRRRSDGVSRELSCKPWGPSPTPLEQPYSFTAHPRKEPKDDETRFEKGRRAHTRVRDAVRFRRVGRVRRVCGRYDHGHVHANPSRT